MDFSRFTNPDAYKQALAGLLRRGGEVTDYIATAPEKAGQAILQGHEKNKALQAQAFANPNRPFQVTNQQAMGELGDRMLAGPLSVAPVGMIAYHGSPHLIKDKFDISKVGTGEGAQSYGHGMYFAENPAVAKEYADMDTKMAKTFLRTNDNDILKAIEDAEKQYDFVKQNFAPSPQTIERNQKTIDYLKNKWLKDQDIAGNFYKVDIPDEYIPKMLDYDKPIKDQPELYELIKSRFTDPDLLATFEHNASKGISGSNAYMNYLGGKTDKERSANALALGIKGIKYLDQGSRSSKITNTPLTQLDAKIDILKKDIDSGLGNKEVMERKLKNLMDERARTTEQTFNYVVFDPTDVKILERNNQPVSRKELLQQQIDKIE
jgi:hypothetical protein